MTREGLAPAGGVATDRPAPALSAELEAYRRQVEAIRNDARSLLTGLDESRFNWRPAPGRWSVGQCLEHLNLCADGFILPSIDRLIQETRARGLTATGPSRYGRLGDWFIRFMEPPVKMRVSTAKELTPPPDLAMSPVVDRFLGVQDELVERMERADGLDLAARRARLPVLIRRSLGQWLAFTAAHERRHLWQARQLLPHPELPR